MQTTLRIILGGYLLLAFGHTALVPGQEAAASPAVEAFPRADFDEAAPRPSGASADDNRWRYRQRDGRWWYWLPSNRWVIWMDGRWVEPPTHSMALEDESVPQFRSAPVYAAPGPSAAARRLQPRPQSWYFSQGVYDGPRYYYDEFYSPYGGARPYPYYPVPQPYSRDYFGRYPYPYYSQPGAGISIGGGGRSGVRIGIGF